MKKTYLILSILGFLIPNFFVLKVSIETGNILLWYDLETTLTEMFSNSISTIFIIDLLLVVFVFFIWSYHEAKKLDINRIWMIWVLTMMFGLAGGFPLFLYLREGKRT